MFRILLVVLAASVALGGFASANAFTVTASNTIDYTIDGQSDPVLTLTRGQTYMFDVSAPGHPFWIKSVQGNGTGNAYNDGVTNNGTANGTLTFTVPMSAPATLFYNCQIHPAMTGQIDIVSPAPALSPWGSVATALLAMGAGFIVLRRRFARA